MTNFEKWREMNSGLVSPDCYIDFGFYYLISACLQRRVWSGPAHKPLYPNVYTILTGDPGVGKGLVVTEVFNCLNYHKLQDPREKQVVVSKPLSREQQLENELLELKKQEIFREAQRLEDYWDKNKQIKSFDKPLLIPVAADASTYEALVAAMPKSLRRIDYAKPDNTPGIYTHSSLCFCLEEISSLFRKRTEDTVNFLLRMYDCGDYTYDTKTQGKDRIRKPCLNFFGGTTPGFMQDVFGDELLNEGFASRTFFIFATRNRKTSLRIPELSMEQQSYKKEILDYIPKLAKLFGPVNYTDEAWQFLEDWWRDAQHNRPNTNIKLNPYYARKNIHVQKLAMAIHFGESLEMTMGIEPFKKALEVLSIEEKKMHHCLGLDVSNPMAKVASKIQKYIARNGDKYTYKDLLTEFYNAIPTPDTKEGLKNILEHLVYTNQIMENREKHPISKEMCLMYSSVKESKL